MQPKVSIIVPVYNAGVYFEKCLTSLVSQTLQDIEIIVVLDCPTDGSDKIAEQYAAKDSRIKLIYNKTNLHIGKSRNRGFTEATGEYVSFFDADDYCALNMFEELYNVAITKKYDVVICKERLVQPNEPPLQQKSIAERKYTEGNEVIKSCFLQILSNTCTLTVSVHHTHIYRKMFLQKYHIRLLDSKQYSAEDGIFNLHTYQALLEHNGSLCCIPETYYFRIAHGDSISSTYSNRNLNIRMNSLEQIGQISQNATFLPNDILSAAYYKRCILILYTACKDELKHNPLKCLKHLSMIKNYPTIYQAVKHPPKKAAFLAEWVGANWQIPYITPEALTKMPFTKKVFAYIIKFKYFL
jgi:hypothetical protein